MQELNILKDSHGHADQEWLLNFIYCFKNPPKHIFLVHGEEEPQEILKEKIIENVNIPVTIPSYGDVYDLDEEITKIAYIEQKTDRKKQLRLEVIDRLNILKEEIEDMEFIVKQDIFDDATKDEDVVRIREKIKEIEKQIVNIIEVKE